MEKWLKTITIRHALIAIIAISLITLTFTSILLGNTTFTKVSENSIESDLLPNQLAKVEAKIMHQLSTPLVLSKSITQNKYLLDWALASEPVAQEQGVIDYLSHMKNANDAFVVFWVSNVSQNYFNNDGILKQISEQDDAWFYNFINSDKPFEIVFDYEEATSKLTAFINYKVQSQGQKLAVAGLGYSVDQISADILSNKVGDSGYVFVTDKQGKVIIHPKLSSLKSKQLKQFDGFAQVADKLLQNSDAYVFDKVEKDGIEYYVASVGISELNWKLIAMLPVSEPMSLVRTALTKTAIMNSVLAMIFIVLMVMLANRITKPIIDIGDRLLEMAKHGGDLTQKLDDTRTDELGLLAGGFNAIIEKVRNIMVDIKQTEQVMASSFVNLNTMADTVDDCTKTQQQESDSVAAATTQMHQSIQEVSDLASNTSLKTEHTQAQIENTNQQVLDTNNVMQQLDISNNATQEKIKALAEQTQTISSVVDTISSISEQTNLLALNAAIEAARAGEQGRGFAVVADEVRSLAGRTQNSTAEINEVIEKLQQQAQETVVAMSKNSDLVKSGLEKTNIASDELSSVVSEINEITNMNTSVATATNEQSSVIGELNVNVTSIADMSTQVAELSQESKMVLSQLDEQKLRLSNLVSQFKTD